jgi:hypothetical protein
MKCIIRINDRGSVICVCVVWCGVVSVALNVLILYYFNSSRTRSLESRGNFQRTVYFFSLLETVVSVRVEVQFEVGTKACQGIIFVFVSALLYTILKGL